jgi:hypothetical protein
MEATHGADSFMMSMGGTLEVLININTGVLVSIPVVAPPSARLLAMMLPVADRTEGFWNRGNTILEAMLIVQKSKYEGFQT